MKKALRGFMLVLLPISCFSPTPPPTRRARVSIERSDTSDPKQTRVLEEAQEEHAASGPCAGDKSCESACRAIYKHRKHKDLCVQRLPFRQVELLEGIYAIFSSPQRKDLNNINPRDLRVLMGISPEPLITLSARMRPVEAKTILTWLAEEKPFMEVIYEEDLDFKVLKAFLAQINSDEILALSTPIYRGSSFIDLAVEKKNDPAVNWIHGFFDEDCRSVDSYTECVFRWRYCRLTLKPRTESFFFGYDPFYDLLVKAAEDNRPSNLPAGHWWKKKPDIDDWDRWLGPPNDVCGLAVF